MPKLTWAVAFFVAALALQSLSQAQGEPTWNLTLVDSYGDGGSLALDSNGNPHVAFSHWDYAHDAFGRRITLNRLDYAVWNGSGWDTETVDSSIQGCVLKLDSADQPHILYSQGGNRFFLKYAVLEGGNWSIQTVDSSECEIFYAMSLDSSGNPHVAYTTYNHSQNGNGYNTQDIKYASYNGHRWTTQTIDTVNSSVGFNELSLALDSKGNPHVIYLENVEFQFPSTAVSGYSYIDAYNIEYASLSESNWQSQTLFTNCTAISNLVFNSDGQPCFCYENNSYSYYTPNNSYSSNDTINFASRDGEHWLARPIPTSLPSSGKLFLNLDASENPQVYFYSQSSRNVSGVYYAHWTSSNWKIRNLGLTFNSSDAYSEAVVDMAFGSDGTPVVAANMVVGNIQGWHLWGNLTYAVLEAPLESAEDSWVIVAAASVAIAALAVAVIVFKRKQNKR